MPTTRRAALYLRQSQYHDQSISMEMQESLTRALCKANGIEVAAVYRDDDTSGRSTTNRPGLRELRAAFDRGEFEIAVAHAVSRFARNMLDGAEIVGDQMPLGSVLEGLHLDRFMTLLHFLFADKQSEEISKRWREVHNWRLDQGLPATGRARFGYVYKDKRYEVDPVTGPVLVEIYRRYAGGEGWHTLATSLNERGIRTNRGAEWSTPTLRKTCDSGFAAGLLAVGDEFRPGSHEALITKRDWDMYLSARKTRSVLAPRSQTVPWFLSRIAVCGQCGTGLVSSGRKQYPSVSCPQQRKSGTCDGVHVSKPGLEQIVAYWLGAHVNEWAAALPDYSAERQQAEVALEATEAALETLESKKGRLARLLVDEVLDRDGYDQARVVLDGEISEASDQVDAARAALAEFLPADADVYEHLASAPDMATGEWNGLLRKIIRRVEVRKDKVVIVPVVGEPVERPRPGRRAWGSTRQG